MLELIVGMTLIVLAAAVAMYFGIRWQARDEPPIEHEHREP